MVIHQYYLKGIEAHSEARYLSERDRKIRHMYLMRGSSAHAPIPFSKQCNADKDVAFSRPKSREHDTEGAAYVSKATLTQASKTRIVSRVIAVEADETWKAAKLAPFSSQTFAGPFGRSEQEVLKRLSKLEEAGKLEIGSTTIGRSIYRNAVYLDPVPTSMGRKVEIFRPLTSPASCTIHDSSRSSPELNKAREQDDSTATPRPLTGYADTVIKKHQQA